MPKIGRNSTSYAKLSDSLATKAIPEAKLIVSIQAVIPAGMEKKTYKFIDEAQDEVAKAYKKFIKKMNERAEDDDF